MAEVMPYAKQEGDKVALRHVDNTLVPIVEETGRMLTNVRECRFEEQLDKETVVHLWFSCPAILD